jgi:hypothetical protein
VNIKLQVPLEQLGSSAGCRRFESGMVQSPDCLKRECDQLQ